MTPPEGGSTKIRWGTGAVGGSGPPSHIRPPSATWWVRGGAIPLDDPVVMGIINLTPDSFSDGGRFRDTAQAVDEAHALVAAGAAIVDVGGESTRPGAAEVPADREMERVLPFVEATGGSLGVPLSIDTRKAVVARAALESGASIVNDVSGLAFDRDMAPTVAAARAGLVIMHMRGRPVDMAGHARYQDVRSSVALELSLAVERARESGVADDAIVVDPGLGFAKREWHSLALLADLGALRELGFPILVGPSRKSFLGALLGVPPRDRVAGTVAACVAAYFEGARIFRVHDVQPVVQALSVAKAILGARRQGEGERS